MEVFEMKLKKKSFFDEDDENLDPERRKMKEEQEAKENELFIQLFYPLSRKQKLEIWKIWENTINEDTFIRKKEIKDYCEENKCDFLTALCSILFKIHYLYRCTYILDDGTIVSKYLSLCYPEFENLKSFLEERYIKYLNNGNPITEEQRETYNLTIEYIKMERFNLEFDQSVELLRLVDPMRIFTFKYILYEEIELKELIKDIGIERQKNADRYIRENIKIRVKRKIIDSNILFNAHTLDMYYPVSKIETENNSIVVNDKNTNIVEVNNEREVLFVSQYNSKELEEIFNKSMDKRLFDANTKLEDFLYVFGNAQKPIDFKRINWINKGKNKSINKKLLIFFFMKIYNLKPVDVLNEFLTFMNSRVQTQEQSLTLKNKPDSDYNPKELEGFFPKK